MRRAPHRSQEARSASDGNTCGNFGGGEGPVEVGAVFPALALGASWREAIRCDVPRTGPKKPGARATGIRVATSAVARGRLRWGPYSPRSRLGLPGGGGGRTT